MRNVPIYYLILSMKTLKIEQKWIRISVLNLLISYFGLILEQIKLEFCSVIAFEMIKCLNRHPNLIF
jgi:hypothetical protein